MYTHLKKHLDLLNITGGFGHIIHYLENYKLSIWSFGNLILKRNRLSELKKHVQAIEELYKPGFFIKKLFNDDIRRVDSTVATLHLIVGNDFSIPLH